MFGNHVLTLIQIFHRIKDKSMRKTKFENYPKKIYR